MPEQPVGSHRDALDMLRWTGLDDWAGVICAGTTIALPSLVLTNTPAGALTFHSTLFDATAGTNALLNTTVAPAANTTYYVRSTTGVGTYFQLPTCYGVQEITVKRAPAACVNPTVTGPH